MTERVTLSIDATMTERGQITVPAAIRKMLGVRSGRVTFKGLSDGTVIIAQTAEDQDDPALAPFLALLADDIASRPEQLVTMTEERLARAQSLVAGVSADLEADLPDE